MLILALFVSVLSFSTVAQATGEIDLLKELVEISSGSADVTGVNDVQKKIANQLAQIGFTVEKKASPGNKLGDLIVGTFKGRSPKYITFLVHADTVFEKQSSFKGFTLSPDGKTASGPGVIDNKGGFVILFSALKQFLASQPQPKYSLRVISDPGEEVGAPEFAKDFKSYSEDSFFLLGMEPSLDDGSLITSRRGNRWYEIRVSGKEAHAGRAHKEGINACWELAKKIDQISRLTDYSKNLTISVGHIEGGQDKFNIVCGQASAKIDVRFSSVETRDVFQKHFDQIMQTNSVCASMNQICTSSSYKIVDDSAPFSQDPTSLKKIEVLKALVKKFEDRTVSAGPSGGSSDCNILSRPGLPTIDGMGPTGGKMHTTEEFIVLSSLKTRAEVLTEFLKNLNEATDTLEK